MCSSDLALRIVHCDVKPDNIVMDEKGDFYLIDFDRAQVDSLAFADRRAAAQSTLSLLRWREDSGEVPQLICSAWELPSVALYVRRQRFSKIPNWPPK